MFGGPRHHPSAFRQSGAGAEQRQVDCLRAGGDEGDLGAPYAERRGGDIARMVERGTCGAAFGVGARRVAIGHVAKRLAHLGQDRRRAGVVEIYAAQRRACVAISRGWDPAAGSAL